MHFSFPDESSLCGLPNTTTLLGKSFKKRLLGTTSATNCYYITMNKGADTHHCLHTQWYNMLMAYIIKAHCYYRPTSKYNQKHKPEVGL